jgi:hypothetical protein
MHDIITQPRLDFKEMSWKCPKFEIEAANQKDVQPSLIFNYFTNDIMVSIIEEKVIYI